MTDLISRADAIEAVLTYFIPRSHTGERGEHEEDFVRMIFKSLPSADAVSREEYEETDGVVKIEKQNANEVGEIKHIVIHSPNYTRYFYNESMPTSADAVQGEWKHTITWQPYCSNCEYVFGEDEEFSPFWKYCPMCGARIKGGDTE